MPTSRSDFMPSTFRAPSEWVVDMLGIPGRHPRNYDRRVMPTEIAALDNQP